MVYVICGFFSIFSFMIADIFRKNPMNSFLQGSIIRLFCFVGFLILFLLSALRYGIGTDYFNYSVKMANAVQNGISGTEPLFKFIIQISLQLRSTQWIFILSSLLVVGCTVLAVFRQSEYYWLSMYLFITTTFFGFSMNGVRQAISTSIFLYAIQYIGQKRGYKYIILILLATMFHSSAIIYLPIYFLKNLQIKKLNIFGWAIVITIGGFLLRSRIKPIIQLVLTKFSIYGRYYTNNIDYDVDTINIFFLITNLVVLFIIMFTFINQNLDLSENMHFLVNTQILITIFSGFSFVIPVSFRILYMFIPIHILLIPKIIKIQNKAIFRYLIILTVVLMYGIVFAYFTFHSNFNGTLPYAINDNFIHQLLF